MSNKTSNINENSSSSEYFDAYSNSIDLHISRNNNNKKETSENNSEIDFSSMKEDSKCNYESPPKKSLNNINNNYTNNSTAILSSNRPSNLNNNLVISNTESTNKETEKALTNKNSRKKINIHNMNCVKKKLLSPIDENNINLEGSKDDLSAKNDINNINKNININIIINKKNKKTIENKFVYNNTNINNINNVNSINNINDINSETSVYSSLDEISNSTMFKKYDKIKEIENDDEDEKEESNNTKSFNKKGYSFIENNTRKKIVFENSLSESELNNKDYYNYKQLSKENTIIFKQYDSLKINSINFEDIPIDSLTVNDLKLKLREIPVRRKDIPEKKRYLKTLIEIQIFNFDNCPIWCLKINKNGQYLAAGNKIGKIRIYEIKGYDYKYEKTYNRQSFMDFLKFVEEKPIKELYGHKKDIIDLSWSPFKKDLLLSASIDHFVILWDISDENNCLLEKYEHGDLITSVQFSPTNANYFITGCLDKYVRIYNISNYINQKNNILDNTIENNINNIDSNNNKKNKKKMLKESVSNFSKKNIKDFFNITDKITCVSYFPEGNQIAIGTINAKIIIYDLFENNIRYNHSFTCRNRLGKNSLGKKITSIEFINKNKAVITTCDSCIRLVSMNEGKTISKYRGYSNENSMIRGSLDLSSDIIISGSENKFCYVWHLHNEEKKKKNYDYEYFQPFSNDIVECSIIIEEKCFVNYVKKVLKLTNKINILSIIINATDKGKIDVLLNIDEEIK